MHVGTINCIWRFPLKSFGGEKLDITYINNHGIIGDRGYALYDEETEKIVNSKYHKLYPKVLMCGASYQEEPIFNHPVPPVKITLPDGTIVNSTSKNFNRCLSDFFSRKVKLISINPNNHKNALSLITTATLNKLSELNPKSDFDVRRFRMNMLVETKEEGFIENLWIGNEVSLGKEIKIKITKLDPRCVSINLPQDGLPFDEEILITVLKHNSIYVDGIGKRPCAGVYASTQGEGFISKNDKVVLF